MNISGKKALVIGSAAAAGVLAASALLRSRRRMDFRGASVLITGGSRGLGLELSRLFAREGAQLVLLARDLRELEDAQRELSALGADEVLIRQCDIRNRDEVEQAVSFTLNHFGRINVLVNNAGVIEVGPFENTSDRDFEEALDLYVRAPLYLIRAVAPHMKRQGGGRIVNISSVGGLVAVPHLVPYSVGKFGETALSDGLRAELAKDNIRVTTVLPGLMRTGSYLNAVYQGQYRKEYGWFAASAALPVFAVNSAYAARRILRACRYGDPYLIISLHARMLHFMNSILPGTTARLMKAAARLLPSPEARAGAAEKTGWESESAVVSFIGRSGREAAMRNNERRRKAA